MTLEDDRQHHDEPALVADASIRDAGEAKAGLSLEEIDDLLPPVDRSAPIEALRRHWLATVGAAARAFPYFSWEPRADAWLEACANAEACAIAYLDAAEDRRTFELTRRSPLLLPCPFCGSEDVRVSSTGRSIDCQACGALGPLCADAAAAAAGWNRAFRPSETTTCAQCEEAVHTTTCSCDAQSEAEVSA